MTTKYNAKSMGHQGVAEKMAALERAVAHFGTQSKMARQIGVTRACVGLWVHGRQISAERAVQMEMLTDGLVTREELRPDLFVRGTGY